MEKSPTGEKCCYKAFHPSESCPHACGMLVVYSVPLKQPSINGKKDAADLDDVTSALRALL